MIAAIITALLITFSISGALYLFDIIKNRSIDSLRASIQLDSSDPLFHWVIDFLLEKGLFSRNFNKVTAQIERKGKTFDYSKNLSLDNEKPEIQYIPAMGYQFFRYKSRTIVIFHSVGNVMLTGMDSQPVYPETLTLSCLGPKNFPLLKDLCEHAMARSLEKDQDKTKIYAVARYEEYWEKVMTRVPRPLHTVILDAKIAEEIIEDIKSFQKSHTWYIEHGVPYRRGYLLYGPPGTGKTSFVLAVAAELRLNICPVDLSGMNLNDDLLMITLNNTPMNSIILLEDVDGLFVERTSVDEQRNKVTFAGLLHALDGVRSQEGRIIFMTTNHIEKLDMALLRPGRADLHVKLDFASEEQIMKMFRRFYPGCEEALVEKFASLVPENKISMAKLQGHFLRFKADPEGAVKNANFIVEQPEFSQEMTIKEWLKRLNLENLASGFHKQRIRRVRDLKGFGPGDLEKCGVKRKGDLTRILRMLSGDERAKKGFAILSKDSIRGLLGIYLPKQQEVESFLGIICEHQISEYQLRDIFEKDLSRKPIDKLTEFVSGTKKKSISQKALPSENPEEVLRRLKMEDLIGKFTENDVLGREQFYNLDEGILAEIGVDHIGKRFELMREIERLKRKCEEDDFFISGEIERNRLVVY